MKRKAAEAGVKASSGGNKKVDVGREDIRGRFREGLFAPKVVKGYVDEYAASEPYKHAVVHKLIDDTLLRGVRNEVLEHIHFTPKETDIYKIHQSGDLANLSGLPSDALKQLPSLLQLRDALYSPNFRAWVSEVSGAGKLSGKKTDMAVNVYAPGCHLLCHDDVIGSRRVSYILYLTNPDKLWRADWGGALRLYPTEEQKDEQGAVFKVPKPEWVKSIPPAWNQLSFFAVQPGESFHDVEEVYKRIAGESEDDGGRVRMAISGWFHIPQEGEDGFEAGLEESLAEKSSLQQLQGKADKFDLPQPQWLNHEEQTKEGTPTNDEDEDVELTEDDLQFLLRFMTANYLTPDTVEELNEMFADESSLQLANFLSKKFSARLRDQMNQFESGDSSKAFLTSTPPYKHRYRYLQPTTSQSNGNKAKPDQSDAYDEVLNVFLPSLAFRKWLSLATGMTLGQSDVLARRFRRGLDYQLATGYEGENPQLEYCLCVTPTTGWGGDEEDADADADADAGNGTSNDKGKGKEAAKTAETDDNEDNVGGYELYMAGDDADPNDNATDAGSDDGVTIPSTALSGTGAGTRRSSKRQKRDPAVYQAAAQEDDDDGILFSNPASWNTLSVVLRDRGVLRFVKYVSRAAGGDRWDFSGRVAVLDDDDDEENEEDDAASAASGAAVEDEGGEEDEEEWAGFDD